MNWTIDFNLYRTQFGGSKASSVTVHEEAQQYERNTWGKTINVLSSENQKTIGDIIDFMRNCF